MIISNWEGVVRQFDHTDIKSSSIRLFLLFVKNWVRAELRDKRAIKGLRSNGNLFPGGGKRMGCRACGSESE